MKAAEIIASLTGLVNVWLTVKNSIWNWIWGIISVALFGVVFLHSRLYSNAGLQLLYFLPMQFYGWWIWARGGPTKSDDLPITLLTSRSRAAWSAVTLALSAALGCGMARYTDAALPYWDAAVTAMSVVAQYLLARKLFENWVLWLAVDLISVCYLYPTQHLYVTTGLYVVFLILAVMGTVEWLRIMRAEAAHG
jgi:nicotinamide mononucleotide transporter